MTIDTLEIIAGNVDRKIQGAVRAWATENRTLLLRYWRELSEAE